MLHHDSPWVGCVEGDDRFFVRSGAFDALGLDVGDVGMARPNKTAQFEDI